jgi:serine/threonine-protein kinase
LKVIQTVHEVFVQPGTELKGRYEILEVLGQGGMGVVYRAHDKLIKRNVALKTLRDAPDPSALQLFHKECDVLASMSHPNIIEIFDLGEFEDAGGQKPYFVMPLLPGVTLEKLVRTSSSRLTLERSVEIISQTCRGLHAAHERGLIHRDLKPSNLFVMEDDSVKIIDFGVAHIVDTRHTMGLKGTLVYMSPEQIEMKPLSPLSDIFSLGVVCYETLTGRRPFERGTPNEIIQAILNQTPPPASELNPMVSQAVGRVVHKAMAKQPFHRFPNAREFAEALQKSLRNEPVEFFDAARLQPRIQRVSKAFEESDFQFADEILSELEAEGHVDPAISQLRRRIELAKRNKSILQLLENARTRFEQEEYPLALQKIREVLQLDPENAAALSLRNNIESNRAEQKIEDWFRLARQHMDHNAYVHARQALQNVLQLKPDESRAAQLLADVDRREQEYLKARKEKEEFYQAALDAWQKGEVSTALNKLDRVLELDRRAPDSTNPEQPATYQNIYNQVRSEHDAIKNSYAEARMHLSDRNFPQALEVCDRFLAKYPGHALFQSLKFDVEEQQRQDLSSYIAEIDSRVEAEPDLDRRVNILKEALERYACEVHFGRSLRLMREKRDLVNQIVTRARLHEERGQFVEALGQWEILQTIYNRYPGLSFEIERVIKRREQQALSESKARWVEQIDHHLATGDSARALDLLGGAQAEFPEDAELAALETLARQVSERTAEAQRLLEQGRELCSQHRFQEGVDYLRQAHQLDERNPGIRTALVDTLLQESRSVFENDWRLAETLIQEALDLDPGQSLAKSLRTLVLDRKRNSFVDDCISKARQAQAAGDRENAVSQVEQGLSLYPLEPRLTQLQSTLHKESQELRRQQDRRRILAELRQLEEQLGTVTDLATVNSLRERTQIVAQQYLDDPEFQSISGDVERRLEVLTQSLLASQRGQSEEGAKSRQAAASAALTYAANPAVSGSSSATLSAGGLEAPTLVSPASPGSTFFSESSLDSEAEGGVAEEDGAAPARAFLGQAPDDGSTNSEDHLSSAMEESPQSLLGDEKRGRSSSKKWILAGSAVLIAVVAGAVLIPRFTRRQEPALPIPLPTTITSVAALQPASQAPAETGLDVTVEGEVPASGGPAPSGGRPKAVSSRSPRMASLVIQDGSDGLQVFIDGEWRGTLKSDGALSITDIKPGQHSVELRKEGYLTRRIEQQFGAATTLNLGADQLKLERAVGTLQIALTPANGHLTYRHQNETENHTLEGNKVDLAEGTYLVTASAPGYAERSQNVQIVAGQSQHLELQLTPVKLKPTPHGMAEWQATGGWRRDGEWYVRRGGDFFFYPLLPGTGDLHFTVNLRRGRRFHWILSYVDAKNYLLFQMDKNNFVRYQVLGGKRTKLKEIPHGLVTKDAYQLQITLSPGKMIHQAFENGKWLPLDEWNDIPEALRNGKFGFYIPGGDELAVSHFEFPAGK